MPTILEAAGFTMETWPNCATIDCSNKRCIWSGTDLCYKCAEQVLGTRSMESLYHAATGRTMAEAEADNDDEEE